MVIVGYALWGLFIMLFALTGNLGVAIGLAFGQGVANMIFIIPSQTLFQERTPPALMGRVVGFRFALVFGSMTIAMLAGLRPGRDPSAPAPVLAVVRGRDDRRGPGGPARCRPSATPDERRPRRLRYTGARAAPDDRGGHQE